MQNMHLSLNGHETKNNMDKLNHSEVEKGTNIKILWNETLFQTAILENNGWISSVLLITFSILLTIFFSSGDRWNESCPKFRVVLTEVLSNTLDMITVNEQPHIHGDIYIGVAYRLRD